MGDISCRSSVTGGRKGVLKDPILREANVQVNGVHQPSAPEFGVSGSAQP